MDPQQLEAFMAAIRRVESGGNYAILGPETRYGRPSGAYQFLDSTWGGYGGYRRAADAPAGVQDERARQLMSQYYNQFGRWDLVAVAWHGGPGAAQRAAADPNYTSSIGDQNIRTSEYVNRVMGGFTNGGFDQAQFLGGAGVPEQDSGVGRKWKVPGDGVLMDTAFGQYLVFDLDNTVRLFYRVDDTIDVSGYTAVPFYDFAGPSVSGGDAAELETVTRDYGSMAQYWRTQLELYVSDPEARKDPGVLEVYAQLLARPDMSPEELDARLRKTSYWNGRTEKQLAWNDLSDADKYSALADEAAWLTNEYFRLVGEPIAASDPLIAEWAQTLAQGKASRMSVSEVFIKPIATQNAESPWSRTVRSETENQRARGVDVSNSTGAVRDLANRWGVQLSDETLTTWGRDLVEKKRSEEDLVEYLKNTAAVLFPWKDRELETRQAAEPWLQAYERTLERKADLLNPVVLGSLQKGESLLDFEIGLKRRPEWMDTKNARDTLASAAGDIGRRMGFE